MEDSQYVHKGCPVVCLALVTALCWNGDLIARLARLLCLHWLRVLKLMGLDLL